MAIVLRLSDEQVEALRRVAHVEHRSVEEVARAAIDEYLGRAQLGRRRCEVPVSELLASFADLPGIDSEAFRADQERHINPETHHDRNS